MKTIDADILTNLAVFSILSIIHVLVFVYAYKKSTEKDSPSKIIIRGIIAGATANYFVFALGGAVTNGFGHRWYSLILIFVSWQGLFYALPIAMIFTAILYWFNDRLKNHQGFWTRLLIGALLGSLSGMLFVGLVIPIYTIMQTGYRYLSFDDHNFSIIVWLYFIAIGGLTSVMVRVSKRKVLMITRRRRFGKNASEIVVSKFIKE